MKILSMFRSIRPLVIRKRQRIEDILVVPPIRHHSFQQRNEFCAVMAYSKMNQFMRNDVFYASKWFLCQFQVDHDAPVFRIAASPFCSHALDADFRLVNA
jgi:hypothetical protein